MKHYWSIALTGLLILFSSGCGHSVIRVDRGTGIVASIPLPSGSSLIEVKLGNIDSTTAVLRGGAVYNADNAKGGTFGSVSTGDHIQVVTQPAINEGYAKSVLSDPEVGDAVKIELVKYFASQKVQKTTQSAARAVNSTAATGDKPPKVEPIKTGMDNVVDKVTEVAPEVVKPIAKTVTDTTSNVKEASINIVRDIRGIVKYVIIGIAILAFLILIALFFYVKWKKKHNKDPFRNDSSTSQMPSGEQASVQPTSLESTSESTQQKTPVEGKEW